MLHYAIIIYNHSTPTDVILVDAVCQWPLNQGALEMNKLTSATASNNDSGKTTLTWVRQSVNTYFSFSLGEASYKEGFVTTTHKGGCN